MSDVNSFNIFDDSWLNKDTFIVVMELMIFLLNLARSRGGHLLVISFGNVGHRVVLIELEFSAVVVLDVDWGDWGKRWGVVALIICQVFCLVYG